jgi:beta-glucanase (GH16 family)
VEELEVRALPSVLIWDGKFNGPVGSAPDPAKWGYDLGGGGWGNNELEVYTNSLQNASIVADAGATDGKALAIRAVKEPDGTYTSARLKTAGKFDVTYGRVEVRAKLPFGQGMWPAFWMLGSNIGSVGWPNCGEVDVMENIGKEPSTVHGSMHGPGYSGGNPLTAAYSLPGGQQFKDAYHVFAADWGPTAVRFYVDDQLYETRTPADLPPGKSWAFDHSFFLLLNLAVGGNWPGNPDGTTVFPQTYLVDYVRVYADIPADWSTEDVGSPGKVGGAAFDAATGGWSVAGGGADIWGTADQFRLASQAFAGDGSVVARVNGLQSTDAWAKAGVMYRDSVAANAPFADVVVTPGNGVAFEWRASPGAPANDVHVTGLSAPLWVKLARSGDDFDGFYSGDGVNWTQIGGTQTVPMNGTAQAGLAVTAHSNGALNLATFTHVSLLPAGWGDADIGGPGRPGSADYDPAAGAWTVAGGGADIWGTSDQFHLASARLTGDGSLVARVASLTNTDAFAKAGVMLRDSLAAAAPFADVVVTPGQGVKFEWRSVPGGQADLVTVAGVAAPVWVMVARSGNAFSGSYSLDGGTWIPIGSTQTLGIGLTARAGLAVTAHNDGALNSGAFDNVALTAAGTPIPVDLSGNFNLAGIVNDGTTFSGGLDGNGNAYSGNLLGTSLTAGGVTFNLGPAGANNAVSALGQTISLPPGQFSALTFLGAAVYGPQQAQTFTVTYSDGTTDTFTQDMSDWLNPQGFAGESVAASLGYYDAGDGSTPGVPNYLYQYTFALNPQKTVLSITLPSNANVMLFALDLLP